MSKKKVEDKELKIWLAVRKDIKMSRGKLATQAGHGYCGALMNALAEKPDLAREYMRGATPKITVSVPSEDALTKVYRSAIEAGIPASLIRDAGRTEFGGPTLTVCAFGPALRGDLPPYLARLQLLKDEEPEQAEAEKAEGSE